MHLQSLLIVWYVLLQIERTSLCMCVSISAAVALACLFAPKVYIVLFQPHKNVRQVNNNSSTTQKSTGRPQFARTQNKFETCVTYNGSVVSSEIQRSPENVFQDSFEDSSFDEGVAMQTPSTWELLPSTVLKSSLPSNAHLFSASAKQTFLYIFVAWLKIWEILHSYLSFLIAGGKPSCITLDY